LKVYHDTNHEVTKLTFSWSRYVSLFLGMIQQAVVRLKHSLRQQYIVTYFGYTLNYKFGLSTDSYVSFWVFGVIIV